MPAPLLSVLIVNWNGKHFLAECLDSLQRQDFQNFEIIVADNGSSDGSQAWLRTTYPAVRLLELTSNLGFVAANLRAYEQAAGTELIVLLNNDAVAAPGWLSALVRAAREKPEAGSFACKMLQYENRERIDNCGCLLTAAGASVDLGRDQPDGPEFSRPRWVFGACAGAAAYRRAMLREVGFFDPDIFITYDDLDVSFRAQLRGWKCWFVADAVVYHHGHGTIPERSPLQAFHAQRNIELVYIKNMPLGPMLKYAPLRLFYECGALAYFLSRGLGVAFLRAKLAALGNLPRWWAGRRRIQRGRTITSRELSLMFHRGWMRQRAQKVLGIGHQRT